MPTYAYACPTCGIVETYQSIKEDALKKCPQCKKAKVTRILSGGSAVLFKGSGFWETDYNRSPDYAKKAKEDAAPEPAPAAQAEPKAAPGDTAKPASTPTKSPASATPEKPPVPPKTPVKKP